MNNNEFLVIDDFLKKSVALSLRDIFKSNDCWKNIKQKREFHYQHVFKSSNSLTPNENEEYSASFSRAENIENSDNFRDIYQRYIINKLIEVTNLQFGKSDVRCYKLESGDYYRSHCDDYAGDIGLILYLNEDWKYDWGGLLHIVNEDRIETILPKFNRAVVIWHEKFKKHHCVSEIAKYALEPRFTITSFNQVFLK